MCHGQRLAERAQCDAQRQTADEGPFQSERTMRLMKNSELRVQQ